MRNLFQTDNITLPATGTLVSKAYDIGHLEGYSIVYNITAGAVGTLTIQASNDAAYDNVGSSDNTNPNATWTTIPSTSNAVNGATTGLYNVAVAYYRYFRYVYTATSGTATAVVNVYGKGPQA